MRRAGRLDLDQDVRRLERDRLDHVDRPRRRVAAARGATANSPSRPADARPAPRGRDATRAPRRSARASRCIAIGRSCGNGSNAATRPGVRSSRTMRSASHAASDGSGAASTRAHSHHSGAQSGWWWRSRRHVTTKPGGIVVELREAVGRLGDERAIVTRLTGDPPQALEGLHRRSRYSLARSISRARFCGRARIPLASNAMACPPAPSRRSRRTRRTAHPRAARRRDRALARGRPRSRGTARSLRDLVVARRQAAPAGVLPLGVRRRRRRPRRPGRRRRRRRARAAPQLRARARRHHGRLGPPPRRARGAPARSSTATTRRRLARRSRAGSARARRSSSATSRSSTPTCSWRGVARRRTAGVRRAAASSSASASTSTSAATATRRPRSRARPAASSGTSPGSTRSSVRCTSAPRSRAGSTSCGARSARSGSRSARRSRSATTCSACSATEAITGKPVGDDLREGKLTPLLAAAAPRATDAAATRCSNGSAAADLDADEIAALRDLAGRAPARSRRSRPASSGSSTRASPRSSGCRSPTTAEQALAELGRFVAWRDR